MRPIKSRINPKSEAFRENYRQMSELVEEMDDKMQEGLSEGKDKHIQKARKQGKYLARERIELLLIRMLI